MNAITILLNGVILGQGLGRPRENPEGEAHPRSGPKPKRRHPVNEPVTVARLSDSPRRRSAAVFGQTFEGVLGHRTLRPLEVKAGVMGLSAIALLVWFWTAVEGR